MEAVCDRCPVRAQCQANVDEALARGEQVAGFRAGVAQRDRPKQMAHAAQ